jgi:hypothetical protein
MQANPKLESIVEAVRQGLEGDSAVAFVCGCGHAINATGIARNLRALGGRGRVRRLLRARKTNAEIVELCLSGITFKETPIPPKQEELFPGAIYDGPETAGGDDPVYDTTKVSLRIPSDLFEAIRIAAKVEGKTQNQLIVDLLTLALSRLPQFPPEFPPEES